MVLTLILGALAVFLAITINNRNVNPDETSAREDPGTSEDCTQVYNDCMRECRNYFCSSLQNQLAECNDSKADEIRECERAKDAHIRSTCERLAQYNCSQIVNNNIEKSCSPQCKSENSKCTQNNKDNKPKPAPTLSGDQPISSQPNTQPGSGTNTGSENNISSGGGGTGAPTQPGSGTNAGSENSSNTGGSSTGERCGNIVCGPSQYCLFINDGVPECSPVGQSCEHPKCGNVRCGPGRYCSYTNGAPECCQVGKDCTRPTPPPSSGQTGSGNNSNSSNSGNSSNTSSSSGSSGGTTPTPTPDPRPDLCQSTTISRSTLGSEESLTITSTANTNVKSSTYGFYNLDNLYGPGNPKPIYFEPNTHYVITKQVATPTNSRTITINFNQLNRPDLNWNGGIPFRISVNAYFTDTTKRFSRVNSACIVSFTLKSQSSTPTSSPTPSPTLSPTPSPTPSNNSAPTPTASTSNNPTTTQPDTSNNVGNTQGNVSSGKNQSNSLPDKGLEDFLGVFIPLGILFIVVAYLVSRKRFEDRVLR